MSVERTLSIIKPDAVGKNVIGEIVSRFEKGGLKVVAMKCCSWMKTLPVVFMPSTRARGFLMT